MLDPTPLTRTKELPDHFTISPKKNGKANVPNDPDPDPSLSDSSSKEQKPDKKKKRRKYRKDYSSYPSLSDDSDSSDDSDYRRKERKRNIDLGKVTDQIMRMFYGKVADDSV